MASPFALDRLPAKFGTSSIVRAGQPSDAIDGVVPGSVLAPESSEALAAVLAWASAEGVSVVIRGGGTKRGWGRPPTSVDLVVSTHRLNRVLAHQFGDLTATIEAGAAVLDVNRELGRHRQWLPIDVADDGGTIGGAIATADSGPLRHRFGTPRDQLIGVHLALADGRLVKAGGNVVKNVAGYDLGKLMSGSFGSLAAIVSATFKLAPLPTASASVVATFRDSEALGRAAAAISGSQLEPAAFEVYARAGSGAGGTSGDGPRLLIQFASTQAAVDAQVGALRGVAVADAYEVVTGAAEAQLWQRHTRALWQAPGLIVRASWLPANLGAVLTLLAESASGGLRSFEMVGRAGVGAGLIRFDGDLASSVAAIGRLRATPTVIGHVVLLRADLEVKRQVDVWGPPGDHQALLAALKHAFDPHGVLGAGRGTLTVTGT